MVHKMCQILNKNLLVSVSEFRIVVSVSNIDMIPPGIVRLIPRVALNSIAYLESVSYYQDFTLEKKNCQ